MASQGEIRLESISLYVSEYMPRIIGFGIELANGSKSSELKTKYRCKQEKIDLRDVQVSQFSLKVDSMTNRYQCYTGIWIVGFRNSSEKVVYEKDFAEAGVWTH